MRKMIALVVGNAAYPNGDHLKNPTNDANDFSIKIQQYGFSVILALDASHLTLDEKIQEFSDSLDANDVGLFYFAGHGIQINGENYLLAINTNTSSEAFARHTSLSLNKVLDVMDGSKCSTKIAILDACRSNPWKSPWSRDYGYSGLAPVHAPKGTIIGFATSPGQTASDGQGRNGVYTSALLQHIESADCTIETMFKRVRNTVSASTNGKQISWEHTSLSGEFYFNMSIGKIIVEYSQNALADKGFDLNTSIQCHMAIHYLKGRNWNLQKTGMSIINALMLSNSSLDDLFVLGRNIYQAACGESNLAKDFIVEFVRKTSSLEESKKHALLEGMLFEVYFNKEGLPRTDIKSEAIDELFALQMVPSLKQCFEFISRSTAMFPESFHFLHGKEDVISVTINSQTDDEIPTINGIYVNGKNIFKVVNERNNRKFNGSSLRCLEREEFESTICRQLGLPKRLVVLTYSDLIVSKSEDVKIACGWTVRKFDHSQ
jgi:hypothetical protein